MEIITKRPKGMSFEDYKVRRRESNAKIRRYLKYGRVYYLAAGVIVERNTAGNIIGERYVKNKPFIGKAKYDLRNPV